MIHIILIHFCKMFAPNVNGGQTIKYILNIIVVHLWCKTAFGLSLKEVLISTLSVYI